MDMDDKISALRYIYDPTFMVLKAARRQSDTPVYFASPKTSSLPSTSEREEDVGVGAWIDYVDDDDRAR